MNDRRIDSLRTPRVLVSALVALAVAWPLASVAYAVPADTEPAAAAREGGIEGLNAATLYAQVRVIGASASSGFGVVPPSEEGSKERLRSVNLAQVADCAAGGASKVVGKASSFFFSSPLETGTAQVEWVLADETRPSLVIAGDFLFWFTYGSHGTGEGDAASDDESVRLKTLESGLALLDRLVEAQIPVVVGDVPDMSPAVGKMLSPRQMPAKATLQKANERIRAWAEGKKRVAVMPLAKLVEDLRSGKPFESGRRTWSEASDGALIQRDQLHPTFAGLVAVLACSEQAANQRFLGIAMPGAPGAPKAFEHDPSKVAGCARERAKAAKAPATPPAQGAP